MLGSSTKEGLKIAKDLYESILEGKIRPMKSIKEAEAVKMVENSFRDINIAFMPHFPGRGVGGHCIPVDPYYLIEKAKQSGFDHKFLRIAREINNYMPTYTVELMQDLLNDLKMSMNGSKIGVMGLSYKADVDDLRETPAFKIIEDLKDKNAQVVRFDPYVLNDSDEKTLEGFLKKLDAVILVTNHKEFLQMAPEDFAKYGVKAVVDGMNCLDGEVIKKSGVKYHGVGRQ